MTLNKNAKTYETALARARARIDAATSTKAAAEPETMLPEALPDVIPAALSSVAKSSLRTAPPGDAQSDFFVPRLYDMATKDSRDTMDFAVFRLSKKDKRPNALVRCELPNGYVEIQSGPKGMASIWDYDIVLMAISHLTEAVNLHRAGKGDMPGRVFRPQVSEILKFCRRSDGGRQYEDIEAVLDRLKTTTVKMVRTVKGRNGKDKRIANAEGLIARYETISDPGTGRVNAIDIEVANWMYEDICSSSPNVLTVSRDYFLIEPGIGRFVYRLARMAAGKSSAVWSFRLLYERSFSAGTFKEFCRLLRNGILASNDLPEYLVSEVVGRDGPMLLMAHRDYRPRLTTPIDGSDGDSGSDGSDGQHPNTMSEHGG